LLLFFPVDAFPPDFLLSEFGNKLNRLSCYFATFRIRTVQKFVAGFFQRLFDAFVYYRKIRAKKIIISLDVQKLR
jgi:hypothetical protein